MKKIKLTQGKYTLVDDADYEWLNQWKWKLQLSKNKEYAWRTNSFYAVRIENGKTIRMHREIMKVPKGMEVDHRNYNGLDNRKENLRICTRTQNIVNRITQNSTGYRGVNKLKSGKFQATIRKDNKRISLGTFKKREDAAIAYNQIAKEIFGEYAILNQIIV